MCVIKFIFWLSKLACVVGGDWGDRLASRQTQERKRGEKGWWEKEGKQGVGVWGRPWSKGGLWPRGNGAEKIRNLLSGQRKAGVCTHFNKKKKGRKKRKKNRRKKLTCAKWTCIYLSSLTYTLSTCDYFIISLHTQRRHVWTFLLYFPRDIADPFFAISDHGFFTSVQHW